MGNNSIRLFSSPPYANYHFAYAITVSQCEMTDVVLSTQAFRYLQTKNEPDFSSMNESLARTHHTLATTTNPHTLTGQTLGRHAKTVPRLTQNGQAVLMKY